MRSQDAPVFGPYSTFSKFLDSHLIKHQHQNLERISLIKDWKDYLNQSKYVINTKSFIPSFLLSFDFNHVHLPLNMIFFVHAYKILRVISTGVKHLFILARCKLSRNFQSKTNTCPEEMRHPSQKQRKV